VHNSVYLIIEVLRYFEAFSDQIICLIQMQNFIKLKFL